MATVLAPLPNSPRRYWQLPMFTLGVCACIAAYFYFPMANPDGRASVVSQLAELRQALGKKTPSISTIAELTKKLENAPGQAPEFAHEARYLAMSGHIALAERGPAAEANTHWQAASSLLSDLDSTKLTIDADITRFPFRKAKILAATRTGDAADILNILAQPPQDEDTTDVARYMADTSLRLVPTDNLRAKTELSKFLAGSHQLTPVEAARYRLRLGDILVSLNQPLEAKAYLTKAAEPQAPTDVRAMAMVLLARLSLADDKLQEARQLLQSAAESNALPAEALAQVRYQLGDVLVRLNLTPEALAAFETASLNTGTLGTAAKVRLAELMARDRTRMGRRGDAVDHLEKALASVTPQLPFNNPHLRIEHVQAAFEEVLAVCLKEGDDVSAGRAVEVYGKIAPADRAREKKAEVLTQIAAKYVPVASRDAAAHAKVQAAYTQAAQEYDALAMLLPTALGKCDALRKSAAALRAIGNHSAAKLKLEQAAGLPGLSPETMGMVLADAGAAALAAKDTAGAKATYQKAVNAGGAGGFTARVAMAGILKDEANAMFAQGVALSPQAKAEAEATATFAMQLLEQAADAPTIQDAEKPAHEKALYELGRQLLARNRIPDAEARFRKMLQLYPKAMDAPTAKLCLASTLLAQVEKSSSGASDPRLAEALALLDSVSQNTDKGLQTQAKLRVARAYLGVGKYEEAVKAAVDLADTSKGSVEELIALSMAYNAYAYQNQWDQAGVIASRMRGTFKELPETAFAGGTPEYTKGYWNQNWFDKLDKVKPTTEPIRPVDNKQP